MNIYFVFINHYLTLKPAYLNRHWSYDMGEQFHSNLYDVNDVMLCPFPNRNACSTDLYSKTLSVIKFCSEHVHDWVSELAGQSDIMRCADMSYYFI